MSNYTDAETEWEYKKKLSRENKVIICDKCNIFTSVLETVIDFDTYLKSNCYCGGKKMLVNFNDSYLYIKSKIIN